jgi:hypothetical protein
MQRENARMIDDDNRGNNRLGEGSTTEEGMRWQMQIQEDVSVEKSAYELIRMYALTSFGLE